MTIEYFLFIRVHSCRVLGREGGGGSHVVQMKYRESPVFHYFHISLADTDHRTQISQGRTQSIWVLGRTGGGGGGGHFWGPSNFIKSGGTLCVSSRVLNLFSTFY